MIDYSWISKLLRDAAFIWRTTVKASDTLEHQPTVCPVPYACAQPYHPGSGSHRQPLSCEELALNGCYATASAVKGRLNRTLVLFSYAMLMRPNKAETAVRHGCHYQGDMTVGMRKILVRPWVGVRVCHLLFKLIYMTAEIAIMLVKRLTCFEEFGYPISSCIRKSIILMFLSPSRDNFTLL